MKVEVLKTLNDDPIDITNLVQSVSGQRAIGESSEFQVNIIGQIQNYNLYIIRVFDEDEVLKYAGFVINQKYNQSSSVTWTTLSCYDYSYILHHRIIAKKYLGTDTTEGKPELIITDIFNESAPEFSLDNLRSIGANIELLYLKYETVFDALNKLFAMVNDYYWYVDNDLDLHVFQTYEEDGPDFNDGINILMNTVKLEESSEGLSNRVWVIGAKQAAENYIDQYFTTDGKSRIHSLSYEPNYTEIYLDGVLVDSKLESNDDGQQEYLISKKEKVLIRPDYKAIETSGKEIKARYKPTREIVDYFEDQGSIEEYGLFETVIKNKDLNDKLESRRFGRAALKKNKSINRKISFETYERDVFPGQKIYIKIDEMNIDSDWLILSVSRNIKPNISHISIAAKEMI